MSIVRGYPDYMVLNIMYTIKKYPNTTYNDLMMKHLDLPKLAVKVILRQLLKADIVYKDSPEDPYFHLSTKGELVWEDVYEKVQTQFDVLNVIAGRGGMTLEEISDELRWKIGPAERFTLLMIDDGLLTYLDEEELRRRNIKSSILVKQVRDKPGEYMAITPRGKQLWAKLLPLPFIDEL